MDDYQSLSHVRWDCKYHIVFIPKYRKKVLYDRVRRKVGAILRNFCNQKGVEILEGHVMPDHIHMCVNSGKFTINMTSEALTHKNVDFTKKKYGHFLPETLAAIGNAAADVLQFNE